jgi:hypothetical protein
MSNRYLHQDLIPNAATETTIYTVPAATTAVLRSLRVTSVLEAGDVLKVTSTAATVHFYLSYLEVDRN